MMVNNLAISIMMGVILGLGGCSGCSHDTSKVLCCGFETTPNPLFSNQLVCCTTRFLDSHFHPHFFRDKILLSKVLNCMLRAEYLVRAGPAGGPGLSGPATRSDTPVNRYGNTAGVVSPGLT